MQVSHLQKRSILKTVWKHFSVHVNYSVLCQWTDFVEDLRTYLWDICFRYLKDHDEILLFRHHLGES